VRGTTREVLTHFEKTAPRGEIVVVVGGKPIIKEAKKSKFSKDQDEA
jgi:16S rRNA (cytidine1402-2'-O)-methyltransferase